MPPQIAPAASSASTITACGRCRAGSLVTALIHAEANSELAVLQLSPSLRLLIMCNRNRPCAQAGRNGRNQRADTRLAEDAVVSLDFLVKPSRPTSLATLRRASFRILALVLEGLLPLAGAAHF